MKKIFIFTLVFIIGMQVSVTNVYANNSSLLNIGQICAYDYDSSYAKTSENYAYAYDNPETLNMDSEEYYTSFAEALMNHDYETLCLLNYDGNGKKAFKHLDGVVITDYSIKMYEDDGSYAHGELPAEITFNIKKSNNKMFPVGKHKYYIMHGYGMSEFLLFEPIPRTKKISSTRYSRLISMCSGLAGELDYKSYSAKQLKNIKYTPSLIHDVYHGALQNDDGYYKDELNQKIKKFFGSDKNISQKVLSQLTINDGKYYNMCNHSGLGIQYECKKITRNKKTGYYTFDIWLYSDRAKLNVTKKIKFTFRLDDDSCTIKKIDCYYDNNNKVLVTV